MHKVDSLGATAQNEFTNGNPQLVIPRTRLEAKWMNALQREVVSPIEQVGIALDDEDDKQLVSSVQLHVGTITDLRALPVPQLPAGRTVLIYVRGYYSEGDGGGIFRWQGNSNEDDDGGLVIEPDSEPATGRWKRCIDGGIDIKWFGAVAGADNTTAIQAACDSATAGDTVRLTVDGLISAPIIISVGDILIDGCGRSQQFHPSYAPDVGEDWSSYNQMFVADSDRVFFKRVRCLGNIVDGETYYFSGSFIWFASGVNGGGVEECYFNNLRYDTSNSVAIQTRSTSIGISIKKNRFVDCCGSVSLQGFYSHCHDNLTEITDAAGAAPLTDLLGVTDQPYGTDGSTGCSVIGNKVFRSAGAPYSGAIIGANVGSTGFVIANNQIFGVRGGVALYIRACTNGVVHDNLVNGLGQTAAAVWNLLKVDEGCSGVKAHSNKLFNPPVSGSIFGRMLVVATGNDAHDNVVDGGTETHVFAQANIIEGTVPGPMLFARNGLRGANIGVQFEITDNGGHVLLLQENRYSGTMTSAYNNGNTATRNTKMWLENERYLSDSLTSFFCVNTYRFFLTNDQVGNRMPFRYGRNISAHFGSAPSGSNATTLRKGDIFWNSTPNVGQPLGWIVTASGTYGPETDNTGDTDGATAVITGMADTSDFFVGDFVSVSAGFTTTGPFEILSKTANSVTLNTASNAAQSNVTVATVDPVVTAMANL